MRSFRPISCIVILASVLQAQDQPTFYAAYADGLDAMQQRDWRGALVDFQRAVHFRPNPAARVFTYGNNLLENYYPYVRMARCHLELGELDSAAEMLRKGEALGEPVALREPLSRDLAKLLEARITPGPKPSEPPTSPSEAKPPQEPPSGLENRSQGQEPSSTTGPVDTPGGMPSTPTVKPPPKNPLAGSLAPVPPLPLKDEAFSPSQLLTTRTWPRWFWWTLALMALLTIGSLVWAIRVGRSRKHDEPFQDPEFVGPYRVERLLGRGGSANTYLARHGMTGQEVALKVLQPHRMEDPEYLERFRLEAKLGAMLDHPHLVKILDPGPAQGHPWIAMEYVPGQTLEMLLK